MNNKQQNKNVYEILLTAYIALNGVVTGQAIRCVKDLVQDEGNKYTPIALLLYLGVFVHTGARIYEIYRNKINNNKQR